MKARGKTKPFEFVECLQLREMLARVAWDERELLAGIQDVPADSLYYHTSGYFLRSRLQPAPYPSDFATWAAIQVRDRILGERLAVLDPFEFPDGELLRAGLITTITAHLGRLGTVPRAEYGEPFHFMRSALIEVPTGVAAATLREFRDGLGRVDASAIYYHFYESARRRPDADPLRWLDAIGRDDVAARVRRLNPFVGSLEGVRAQVLAICDQALDIHDA